MRIKSIALALTNGLVCAAVPANAARVVTAIDADLFDGAYTFAEQGAGFTFGFNGDYFGGGPVTVSTSTGGQVNTIFGQPTTNFADGRGRPVTFGPSMQYADFASATPIRFTNGDNFIGLRAVTATGTYYGYAFTTNNVLNSVGFENVADRVVTAIQGVPEPASWALMLGGFGVIGTAVRRRQRSTVAFA
ncbi:PEP-CTERM protein-sorting domain-containing protein [Sphingomonas antarctica]|uniref:PEPxxWA-CTERM sorting domain-containing protein n=1 Tax=Sphingomonas antarctica TaxID=2040274 RepID=UPI0039ED4DE0